MSIPLCSRWASSSSLRRIGPLPHLPWHHKERRHLHGTLASFTPRQTLKPRNPCFQAVLTHSEPSPRFLSSISNLNCTDKMSLCVDLGADRVLRHLGPAYRDHRQGAAAWRWSVCGKPRRSKRATYCSVGCKLPAPPTPRARACTLLRRLPARTRGLAPSVQTLRRARAAPQTHFLRRMSSSGPSGGWDR